MPGEGRGEESESAEAAGDSVREGEEEPGNGGGDFPVACVFAHPMIFSTHHGERVEDALDQNAKKVRDVPAKLVPMGYREGQIFGDSVFAGGSRRVVSRPGAAHRLPGL